MMGGPIRGLGRTRGATRGGQGAVSPTHVSLSSHSHPMSLTDLYTPLLDLSQGLKHRLIGGQSTCLEMNPLFVLYKATQKTTKQAECTDDTNPMNHLPPKTFHGSHCCTLLKAKANIPGSARMVSCQEKE